MANGDAELRLGPLRLTLGLVAHQPLGLPSELHVFEWGALAGARLGTRALAPWLLLEAALGGGFLQERYSSSDASGTQNRGVLNDPLGSGSLGAALEIGRGVRIGLDAGTWWTLHARAGHLRQRAVERPEAQTVLGRARGISSLIGHPADLDRAP
jgi:hypothetical protein